LDNQGQHLPQVAEVSRSRRYKIKWRSEGKCDNCGGEKVQGKTKCERCLKNARDRASSSRSQQTISNSKKIIMYARNLNYVFIAVLNQKTKRLYSVMYAVKTNGADD
jgi:hypothetical protein